MSVLRVACVQAEPVLLDAKGSLAKAADLVREAGAQGARLVFDPAGHYSRSEVLQLVVRDLDAPAPR